MTLLVIILVLVAEQAHALPVARLVEHPVASLCNFLERGFNDGRFIHGAIAWCLGVGLPALVTLIVFSYLWYAQGVAAFLLSLMVLYLTMGFRQFSHYYTEIQESLRIDDRDLARQRLADWRNQAADRLTSSEIARLAIEEALLASHRHVFGPLFWFVVLGPAGALLYRLADLFNRNWGRRNDPDFRQFGVFSKQAFAVLDWIPVRLTAFAFAVVGDFEDAVYCWRTQAGRWADRSSGILLASGAGALGVRLGQPIVDPVQADEGGDGSPLLGVGEEADPDFMQSTIGLVWRTLVLILLILVLVAVAGWMGG